MASSHLLKKKLNLLTGLQFRQASAANLFTRSGFPNSNATVSNFLTSSAVTFRQAATSTSSFRSFVQLTRSFVPFGRPLEVTGSLTSRFINCKEFHVDVSGHDSAVVKFMKRLRDKLDPCGWWYLVFEFDKERLLRVVPRKELFRIGGKITDEGIAIRMQMTGVDYHDMEVSVEGNSLFCKGIRTLDYTHNWEFELPHKTYQPSDVKGKIQNGALWVTFTNLKKEDMKGLTMRHEWY